MKTETFIRRPFDVNAVQVTPQNAAEIAEWCGGTIGKDTYKIAGFDTELNTVMVPGNGPNAGKMIKAKIGMYVVEHIGKFRVFRKDEFNEMFTQRIPFDSVAQHFKPGDLVQERDESDGVWQGTVALVDQVLVEYPLRGNFLHDRQELIRIREFNEETNKRILESVKAGQVVEEQMALDKINALRAAAEDSIKDGLTLPPLTLPPLSGSLENPPAEINGMKVGSVIRVKEELNEFFSQCGVVEEILNPTTLSVKMEMQGNPVVKHLAREIELEESTKWVRVSNDVSPQAGWVGWIVRADEGSSQEPNNDVVRVAFRPTGFLNGTNDRCFSYMSTELTELAHHELGAIPTYEI